MLRHQILLAFRNFMKFKSIFFINLFGLAMGLTTVVLIMLWVKDELSISRNHEKIDRIYAVMTNHDNSGGIITWGVTPGEMAEAMKAELSQVELAVGASPFIDGVAFENGSTKMTGAGLFVDQSYFDVFSVDFVAGSPSQVMTGINSLALSETMATKLFGSPKEAIGKSVKWQVFDFHNEVEVTGVYKDFGPYDLDKADYFLSFSYFKQMLGESMHWGNFNASTYVLLRPETDIASFNEQIAGFIKAKAEGSNVSVFVQNYGDTYLYGTYEDGKVAGGRISYVRLFFSYRHLYFDHRLHQLYEPDYGEIDESIKGNRGQKIYGSKPIWSFWTVYGGIIAVDFFGFAGCNSGNIRSTTIF